MTAMADHLALEDLQARLAGPLALAVSGGVDSLTLAHVAHRGAASRAATVFHATSPAVPPEATERVRRHAARFGWRLQVIDAGEFHDPDYLANPHNRCFFCKTNLYGTIAAKTEATIASGTNTDDLGDYRPGLIAAKEHDVRHPFVEAGIDKATVRAIARHLGLDDIAELPAAPCLSSRLETGTRVTAARLAVVHAVERALVEALRPATARCRILADGVRIELDEASLEAASGPAGASLRERISALCRDLTAGSAPEYRPYRRGSAFLRPDGDGG